MLIFMVKDDVDVARVVVMGSGGGAIRRGWLKKYIYFFTSYNLYLVLKAIRLLYLGNVRI